jgi:hypothetical protein
MSSLIDKFVPSLATAVAENTLTLANLNFDFSLYKIEAPTEFRALGASLSPQRRNDAETGTPHRTARKLGALFEHVLPKTPELIKAYGVRVSEIAQSPRLNPRGKETDGPFASHTGADGTAIWAAATSGASAVPMLMLAAMLARLWTPPEATSLWAEILAARKLEIKSTCDCNNPAHFAALQAAQQDISRAQLADWDASARAWLRTADDAKTKAQTQLMLVVNNVNLPVSNNMTVYRSVMDSLIIALTALESIVKGMPQRVQSGAVLLGLSSWHLYPDMVVHGSVTRNIQQHDSLVGIGGIITLGLETESGVEEGVYWSLPLAHLRYYGDPVHTSRSTGYDASRIPSDHLMHIGLGAVLSKWIKSPFDIGAALEWFVQLSESLKRAANFAKGGENEFMVRRSARDLLEPFGWISGLMNAAVSTSGPEDSSNQYSKKLIALGYRRFGKMLAEPSLHPPPMFGLAYPEDLFPLLIDEEEERIRVLRNVAANSGFPGEQMIIRYRHVAFGQEYKQSPEDVRRRQRHAEDVLVENFTYEYASAVPIAQTSFKRSGTGTQNQVSRHKRWVSIPWPNDRLLPKNYAGWCACDAITSMGESSSDAGSSETEGGSSYRNKPWRAGKPERNPPRRSCFKDCSCALDIYGCKEDCPCWKSDIQCGVNEHLESLKSHVLDREYDINKESGEDVVHDGPRSCFEYYARSTKGLSEMHDAAIGLWHGTWLHHPDPQTVFLDQPPWVCADQQKPEPAVLEFLFGDETAALYIINSKDNVFNLEENLYLEDLTALFERDAVSIPALADYLTSVSSGPFANYYLSLKAMASAFEIYKLLPDTSLSQGVSVKPLHSARWVAYGNKDQVEPSAVSGNEISHWAHQIDRASTFACIAMFESGVYDINPILLTDVFAMSSGNSIFVAASVLCDPSESPRDYEVKRIIGNIGRAGIAMMIAPQDPRIRRPPEDTWELINHAKFDGRLEDSFRGTSLHLSFTEYVMPINIGDHGAQDKEAFFIETLISVHDRDRWIADIDILGTFRSNLFKRFQSSACSTDPNHYYYGRHSTKHLLSRDFVAIDNWEELLDRGQLPVVVRAHKNWQSRLATAALSVRQGCKTMVMDDIVCWSCVERFTSDIKWAKRLNDAEMKVAEPLTYIT